MSSPAPSVVPRPRATRRGTDRLRLPLLALGAVSLLAGLAAALPLLGLPVPGSRPALAADHGPLLALGFLGTLIALERAAALRRPWAFLGPAASGLGALALVAGPPAVVGRYLLTAGAVGLLLVYAAVIRRQRALHLGVMTVGAAAWYLAGLLWLANRPVAETAPALVGFLVLTICAERLELSRLAMLGAGARRLFVAAAAVVTVGVALSVPDPELGRRVTGAGVLALSGWLVRYDVARRTARSVGLPRFVGAGLLVGHGWLAVGGTVWVATAATPPAAYDATLHAVFLGFVMALVFAHAPVILPAVLRLRLPYTPVFYAHVALLHLGLLVRLIGGDLVGNGALCRLGGVLNVVAVLLFVLVSAVAVVATRDR